MLAGLEGPWRTLGTALDRHLDTGVPTPIERDTYHSYPGGLGGYPGGLGGLVDGLMGGWVGGWVDGWIPESPTRSRLGSSADKTHVGNDLII